MRARHNSNQTDTSLGAMALIFIMALAGLALVALIVWLLVNPGQVA